MDIQMIIQQGRTAQQSIINYTQEQTDEMTRVVSEAILNHAEELAIMAVKETGLGRIDHKIIKNQNMAKNIYNNLVGKKSVGVIEVNEDKGLTKIAHPIGVIGSVTPTTNPTITPLGNGLMALKGKNAMIVSPHPRALKTTTKTVNIMREALANIGASENLIQIISEPSVEKSQELMSNVDLIVATGGPGMVKAAYSSGKPAYGVGPGNVQLVLDSDFDVNTAAEISVIGRSFDNGIVCACTQSLIYPKEKETDLFKELTKFGAYIVTDESNVGKFRDFIFPDGNSNPEVIGKDPKIIADAVGIKIPEGTEIIALKVQKYGEEELLSKEKMFPILTLISYDNFDEALEIAKANLMIEGKGHSAGILTHTPDNSIKMGETLPVSRVVVNQPTIVAGGSPNNGLNPTVSLGCGSWGNNSISENLKFEHLINISQVATVIKKK